MIERRRKTQMLCASVALWLAGIAEAAADMHYINFNVYNTRPNGETVTGWIVNQGITVSVTSVGGTRMQALPFETSGFDYSTGHYDVRIHRAGDQSHQYCDFHATASYQGRQGWYCLVSQQGATNGARCSASAPNPSSSACTFDVRVE